MTAQLPFTADLIQAFGWALLHSFWQAFFIFACLRLVLLLWPQASSSIKYNLSYISLAGIFTWFSVTLWQQIQAVKRVHQAAQLMIETGIRPSSRVEVPVIYKSQAELTGLFPTLEMWFPVLVAIYVAGVAVMTIKLTLDLLQIQQIRKKQVFPIDEAWEKHLQKLAAQLRIPRRVKLLVSQYIQVPVMIGFLKPVILLPVAMFNNLTAEQLEAILLHELAHVKRNDYLLNIFQSIVETILFFNPFVWWISKNIRLEREHCCDDLVLTSQVQPLHYAKALVALEEYRLTVNALAMAAADNKQHLFHRIKRIMEMKTKNINYTQKLLAVMIIAVGLVSIAWLNPSNKDEQRDSKKAVIKEEVATATVAPAIAVPAITQAVSMIHLITDTVPAGNKQQAEKAAKEAAEASMEAAKIGMEAAEEAMKNIDWNQINVEVNNAMKNIDWNQINVNVKTALKNIDWNKINEDIKVNMKNIPDSLVDPKVIQESIRVGMESAKTAMANIDMNGIISKSMAEAQAAMNSKEYKEAMATAKKEIAKAQQEMVKAQKNIRKDIVVSNKQNKVIAEEAEHAEIDKKITSNYKKLVERMAADNLINAEDGFTIEKKNDVLKINDVKQPDDVLKKYADAFGKSENVLIAGKGTNLSVSINEEK